MHTPRSRDDGRPARGQAGPLLRPLAEGPAGAGHGCSTLENELFKVVILYPNGEGKTFDMDYYVLEPVGAAHRSVPRVPRSAILELHAERESLDVSIIAHPGFALEECDRFLVGRDHLV